MSNKVYQRNLPFGRSGRKHSSSRLSFGSKSSSRFSLKTISSITSRKSFAYAFSVFAIAFVASVVSFSILAPIDSSNATNTVTANIAASGYYIGITSHDVDMNTSSTFAGSYGVAYDTITTKTNAPSGYKLYVSSTNDTDYASGKPGNALYKNGDTTVTPFISPATGTFSSPSTLGMNTWGISNSDVTTGEEATFFAMPLLDNPQLIQTTNSANETGVDKRLDFGFKANAMMPIGSYSGTIVYTAAANANTSGSNEILVYPDKAESPTGGETITITTSLYTNYTLGTDDVTVTVGSEACTITRVYTDDTVRIECTMPTTPTLGVKDVTVNIPVFSWTATLSKGFDYGSFWAITYMQDMTTAVCDTVYKPSNVIGNAASIITDKNSYTATQDGTNQVPSRSLQDYRGHNGTGTRENPATGSNIASYTVRKLADGNCWMTDNLALTLTNGNTIERANNTTGEFADRITVSMSGNYRTNTVDDAGDFHQWYYTLHYTVLGGGNSICPIGWRIPGYDSSEKRFQTLATAYAGIGTFGTIIADSPVNLGRYDKFTTRWMGGDYAYYWTSVMYPDGENNKAFYAHFGAETNGMAMPNNYIDQGFNVRCVAI